MNRKIFCAVLIIILVMLVSASAEIVEKPIVGVAWRSNQDSETFVAVCTAIEAAGGKPVVLDMVMSADLVYDAGKLADGTDTDGALTAEAAKMVRCNTWQGSNVEAVMDGITAVVFPGGEDISPSLYYTPQPVEAREGYSAERDVSDYLLMSYCLEKDFPILAICRGMQMLSVVSGADMIQDIPANMQRQGIDYGYQHRNEQKEAGSYRDFTYHGVKVLDHDSLLYLLTGKDVIENAPSWHHQAVKSVEGTRLVVTGTAETLGIEMIEAVERHDKTFVLGLQYHPEISVVRENDEASLIYFQAIVDMADKARSYALAPTA